MIRILSFVLIAIGLLGGAEKAAAAASDVVDRETLKNFVLEAKSLLESAQDEAARTAILETLGLAKNGDTGRFIFSSPILRVRVSFTQLSPRAKAPIISTKRTAMALRSRSSILRPHKLGTALWSTSGTIQQSKEPTNPPR